MAFTLSVRKHVLRFRFDARTSRGSLQQHPVYYLLLQHPDYPQVTGVGECAPLLGLSPEQPQIEQHLRELQRHMAAGRLPQVPNLAEWRAQFPEQLPASVVFALETAFLDWQAGGSKHLFPGPFTAGTSCLPINGLVWMADKETMRQQLQEKIAQGYTCLKLKIGGLAFQEELELLQFIRSRHPDGKLQIRLDANGAFPPEEALAKLEQLAVYQIDSIEQPIRQGQGAAMAALCRHSPIPIALDEELIGVEGAAAQRQLLEEIRPQHIVLKPTLAGGLAATQRWIATAEALGIGWWLTSALESNIGLNAISQLAASYPTAIPQGLGTGQLYHNNIPSPLRVDNGQLCYAQDEEWKLAAILEGEELQP